MGNQIEATDPKWTIFLAYFRGGEGGFPFELSFQLAMSWCSLGVEGIIRKPTYG